MIRNIWEDKPCEIPIELREYAIDPTLFKDYTGSYLTPNLGLLHVITENGKLYLRPDPVPGKEELVPSSDSTFYFRNQDLEWQFYNNEKGDVIGFGFNPDYSVRRGKPRVFSGEDNKPTRELSFHPVSLKGTMKVTTSFKYFEKRLL